MILLINGGWVLWIIIGLSITALAITLQKLWFLKSTRIEPLFIQSIKTQLATDNKESVIKKLQYARNIEGQLAVLAIERFDSSDAVISAEVSEIIKPEIQLVNSKIGFLSMIITVAPVLGLLGTVLGLMDVFSVLAAEGVGNAQLLSAGISKALITTVAGLSLAIPLIFIHQFLSSKIDERLDDWDNIPTQLIAHLRG
ncbi:MAG: MotA/TolQ/ExbB proton channel family protein [Candidatus Margulisiibacteriota bacterium]